MIIGQTNTFRVIGAFKVPIRPTQQAADPYTSLAYPGIPLVTQEQKLSSDSVWVGVIPPICTWPSSTDIMSNKIIFMHDKHIIVQYINSPLADVKK
jgi:hypothetical protein